MVSHDKLLQRHIVGFLAKQPTSGFEVPTESGKIVYSVHISVHILVHFSVYILVFTCETVLLSPTKYLFFFFKLLDFTDLTSILFFSEPYIFLYGRKTVYYALQLQFCTAFDKSLLCRTRKKLYGRTSVFAPLLVTVQGGPTLE